MEVLSVIERRLRYWEIKLARAEGRYHSKSERMDEKSRAAALQDCRRCQAVIGELRSLRDEVVKHGA
jgi:hypothetical protein